MGLWRIRMTKGLLHRDLTQFNFRLHVKRKSFYFYYTWLNLGEQDERMQCPNSTIIGPHIHITHTEREQFVGMSSLVERDRGEVVSCRKNRKIADSPTRATPAPPCSLDVTTTPPFEYRRTNCQLQGG